MAPFSPRPSSSSTTRSDIIKNSQGSSKLIKSFLIHLLQHLQQITGTNLFQINLKNSRGVDDPVCDLLQEPLALSADQGTLLLKPNSLVILTGSDLDFLEDDEPAELKKGSSILSSSSFSISGNNNINNYSTPRIRTRPSLTSSLMSDCSSSPFTEAEDDISEGFFDYIEFPPEFGIPNNLHPASTPSNPSSSLPSSKLHGPTESVHSSSL
ncbi:hypothetical protein BY996DRAFT_8450961 [Phakopsora pachyrhizi]|nr:hypothetical protein BY996DRAFT_8450961 [Phakopsora pachyrhizi]